MRPALCSPHSCNCGARPCLRLSGWSSTAISGLSSANPSSAPILKLSATMRVFAGMASVLFAHCFGQRFPSREVRWIPLLCGEARAQFRARHTGVVAEDQPQSESCHDPGGAAQPARPAGQQCRHQWQQCEEARKRPMEAHALDVGEEAQAEEPQYQQPTEQAKVAIDGCIAGRASPCRLRQRGEQQRRDQQGLDHDEPEAIDMEGPGMPFDQLEAQSGIGVAEVPGDERPPRRRPRAQAPPTRARRAARAVPWGKASNASKPTPITAMKR